MIIYKIKNNINDKIYIGKTIKSLSERIAGHTKRLEIRKKISENNAMKKPEVVQKLIKTKTGMKYKREVSPRKSRNNISQETREKLSIATRNYWKRKKEGI